MSTFAISYHHFYDGEFTVYAAKNVTHRVATTGNCCSTGNTTYNYHMLLLYFSFIIFVFLFLQLALFPQQRHHCVYIMVKSTPTRVRDNNALIPLLCHSTVCMLYFTIARHFSAHYCRWGQAFDCCSVFKWLFPLSLFANLNF